MNSEWEKWNGDPRGLFKPSGSAMAFEEYAYCSVSAFLAFS